MSEVKRYADRDIEALDAAGGYYCRHVSAMTGEGLHSKSAIAAELAYRDMQADDLAAECERLRADLELAMKVPSVAAMHSYLDTECAKQNVQLAAERDAALAELAALKGGREAFTYVTVLNGRIQRQGSEHHCREWAGAWNATDSCVEGVGRAEVIPLYTAPPAQASAWPEGWKLVRSGRGCVTSSMKADCIGEFSFTIPDHCGECLDVGADSDCPVCGGEIEYQRQVDVPWDTCKEIYKAMLAAAPTPGASDGKGGE